MDIAYCGRIMDRPREAILPERERTTFVIQDNVYMYIGESLVEAAIWRLQEEETRLCLDDCFYKAASHLDLISSMAFQVILKSLDRSCQTPQVEQKPLCLLLQWRDITSAVFRLSADVWYCNTQPTAGLLLATGIW